MLEQKWSGTDRRGNMVQRQRNESRWDESLGQRWAVIKFARDAEAEKEVGPPKVESLEDDQNHVGGRSVKEMLAELRLANQRSAPDASAA